MSTYSVLFRELNGFISVGSPLGLSGLSITRKMDLAAIKKPMALNWLM
jgi:hypothetical protein